MVMIAADTLSPIVRWAQNGPCIDITVELIDVKNPQITMNETTVEFAGYGCGAHGENLYQFKLDLFKKIDFKGSTYKVTDRNVSFQIIKQIKSVDWPRLLKSDKKPGWLKIDFDKWKLEDSEEEQDKPEINKISFEQRMKSEVEKAKDDIRIYAKIAWLSIYNLFQAVCFMILLVKIIIKIHQYGKDSTLYVYDDISDLLLTCQLAAILEIINPLVGIVKTNLIAPVMQVCGRNLILFVLIVPEKSMHQNPVVLVLFLVWCSVEVIRYPFYLIALHRYHNVVIEWLRYSAWMVLYPIGFTCEAIIVYQSIKLCEVSNRLSYPLPNQFNISFSLSSFLMLYLGVYFPLCMYLLKHMWILRKRKLGGQKKVKAKQL